MTRNFPEELCVENFSSSASLLSPGTLSATYEEESIQIYLWVKWLQRKAIDNIREKTFYDEMIC